MKQKELDSLIKKILKEEILKELSAQTKYDAAIMAFRQASDTEDDSPIHSEKRMIQGELAIGEKNRERLQIFITAPRTLQVDAGRVRFAAARTRARAAAG